MPRDPLSILLYVIAFVVVVLVLFWLVGAFTDGDHAHAAARQLLGYAA